MSPYRQEPEMPTAPAPPREPWSVAKRCAVVGVAAIAIVDACCIVGNLPHITSTPEICFAIGVHTVFTSLTYIVWATFPR